MEENSQSFINNKSSPYEDNVRYDGQNFIRDAKQKNTGQDIANEVMGKYREKKQSQKKKIGTGKKILIGTALALVTALGVKGGIDLIKENKSKGLNPSDNPIDKLNSDEQKKLAQYITTTGVHKDGRITDLTSLVPYLNIASDASLTEDGNIIVTTAQILKDEKEEYITYVNKTISSSYGNILQSKNFYLDKDGDVISCYEFITNKNGTIDFLTAVSYDQNMFDFAEKVAKTAGKDKTVDALNLTLISSEESLDDNAKEILGEKNTVLQVKTKDKVRVEGSLDVSSSQKGLKNSITASIITTDKNKNDNFFGDVTFSIYKNGESEISLDLGQKVSEHFSMREGISYSNGEVWGKVGFTVSTQNLDNIAR